jgi:N-acyl-D-aspartate/D-glutamate deacylase
MKADIVAFDPQRIIDRSEYTKPHQYSEGVQHLVVNGTPVLLNGSMTGELPGRVLYGPGKAVNLQRARHLGQAAGAVGVQTLFLSQVRGQ